MLKETSARCGAILISLQLSAHERVSNALRHIFPGIFLDGNNRCSCTRGRGVMLFHVRTEPGRQPHLYPRDQLPRFRHSGVLFDHCSVSECVEISSAPGSCPQPLIATGSIILVEGRILADCRLNAVRKAFGVVRSSASLYSSSWSQVQLHHLTYLRIFKLQ